MCPQDMSTTLAHPYMDKWVKAPTKGGAMDLQISHSNELFIKAWWASKWGMSLVVPHSHNREVLDKDIVGNSRSTSSPAKGEDMT